MRRADEPFIAIGIVARLTDWVIGDDVIDEVRVAGIGELMGLVGGENEGISGFNLRRAIGMSNEACAGDHVIEFPLGAMRVVGIVFLSWRNPIDLDIERVSLVEVVGLGIVAEGLGDAFECIGEVTFWRGPGYFGELLGVDFLHAREEILATRDTTSKSVCLSMQNEFRGLRRQESA